MVSPMEGKKAKRPRRSFTDEFKAGAVRLVLDEGRSTTSVAKSLDLTQSTLRVWVEAERANRAKGKAGLTSEERQELQRRHGLNQADVEQSIVDHRVGSDEAAAANKPGVTDGERVQGHLLIALSASQARVNRVVIEEHLRATDQIRELASQRLQPRVHGVGHLRQETTGGDVDEVAIVQTADVDTGCLAREQQIDGCFNILRQAKRGGEVVARAQWDHAECDGFQSAIDTGDAVDGLVQRAVAACNEEMVVAIFDSLCGGVGGITF